MGSAELITLRNAMGMTSEQVATALGVHVGRVKEWESGNRGTPDGVIRELRELWEDVERFASLEALTHLHSTPEPGDPIVLLRYRKPEHRELDHPPSDPAQAPDRGVGLPVVAQAVGTWHAARILADKGHQVQIVWFNPHEYRDWLNGRPNTADAHHDWATTQRSQRTI